MLGAKQATSAVGRAVFTETREANRTLLEVNLFVADMANRAFHEMAVLLPSAKWLGASRCFLEISAEHY
jgi:hypothetical protein